MLYIKSIELTHNWKCVCFDQHLPISSLPTTPISPWKPLSCSLSWFHDFFFLIIIVFLLEQDCPILFCLYSIISRILCPIHFSFSYAFPAPIFASRYTHIKSHNYQKTGYSANTFIIRHIYDSGWENVAYIRSLCFCLLASIVSYSQAY